MGIQLYNRDEIKKIQSAGELTANILDEIEDIIEVGISTLDIDLFARKLCEKYKATPAFLGYHGFSGAICTSLNEVVVHGVPSGKDRLKDGDILGLDFGIFKDGFYGDTARTIAVGNIDQETERLLRVTREALYLAIDTAVFGSRISDVSAAIENHVTGFGFAPVREYTGHGIGRRLHEEPTVPNYGRPGSGPKIRNGMVFAIEPMINAGTHRVTLDSDGWTVRTQDRKPSAHFEHTVAIVDGRAEILTKGRNFN